MNVTWLSSCCPRTVLPEMTKETNGSYTPLCLQQQILHGLLYLASEWGRLPPTHACKSLQKPSNLGPSALRTLPHHCKQPKQVTAGAQHDTKAAGC